MKLNERKTKSKIKNENKTKITREYKLKIKSKKNLMSTPVYI